MDSLHDPFPIQFRIVSDTDALLPTLLTHSSHPPSIIFPLEKVTVQGERQVMINFISLAGLRSHVCEVETATSLPTIIGKTTHMPLESSEEIKVSECWKCIRR